MSRRSSLPGAAELFRSTGRPGEPAPTEPDQAAGAGRSTAVSREPSGAGSGTSRARDAGRPGQDRHEDDWDRAEPVPDGYAGRRRSGTVDERSSAAEREPDREPDRDRGEGRPVRRRPRSTGERRPSGRERHDEKITVYVSADELMDLEHARLGLRGDHGLAVDRGRIVREALAVVIADLDAKGESSILVRRLRGL